MKDINPAIVSERVPDDRRLDFLPSQFGRRFMVGEAMVYDWAARLSVEYSGGFWSFYSLSNGGFYLAPETDSIFSVSWFLNGYEGQLSADAFGIAVTLFALCHLAEKYGENLHINKYHLLREFVAQHAERDAIRRLTA